MRWGERPEADPDSSPTVAAYQINLTRGGIVFSMRTYPSLDCCHFPARRYSPRPCSRVSGEGIGMHLLSRLAIRLLILYRHRLSPLRERCHGLEQLYSPARWQLLRLDQQHSFSTLEPAPHRCVSIHQGSPGGISGRWTAYTAAPPRSSGTAVPLVPSASKQSAASQTTCNADSRLKMDINIRCHVRLYLAHTIEAAYIAVPARPE